MLNLKYGQQAVSRGYVTPQRLQQVLAKQRQLADQGKKVSVRMILEKSKLLTPDQLDLIDRDLNIKVVKKKTSTINKAALQGRQSTKPVQPVSADNFFGDDALPDVSGSAGSNPDATIYSPPPPDMQERIRQEREKAKAAVRQKYDQQAGPSKAPAPQRGQPQRSQPQPQYAQPEPMMEPEMEPEPFASDSPELERMDSSPKLESLPAEFQGISAPEDEALPTLDGGGFDQFGEQAPPQGGFDNLAPAEQGFDQFGEQGGDMNAGTAALGAEPEQGNWGEDQQSPAFGDVGNASPMDATLYSPPPSAAPEMAPQGFDSFGEDDAPAAPAFGDEGIPGDEINATLYSPPPSAAPEAMPEPEPEMAESSPFGEEPAFGEPEPVAPPAKPAKPEAPVSVSGRKLPPGKKIVDDFAGGEDEGPKQPAGLDDVPTVKPRGEPVHPLRRGVSSEINALDAQKSTSKRQEPGRPEPVKAESQKAPTGKQPVKPASGKLPKQAPPEQVSVDLPDEEPLPASQVPVKPSKPEPRKPEKAKTEPKSKAEPAPVATATEDDPAKKKKGKMRLLLTFMFMIFLLAAVLILPIVPQMQTQYPFLGQMRRNEHTRQLYDYVEKWANQVRRMADPGSKDWDTGVKPMKAPIDGVPLPENKPEENKTGENSTDGSKPEEKPVETAPDAEAQWKALYKPGASWVMHMNMGVEMWTKTEVISVDGNKAHIKSSSKMKAEDEFANANESDVEYKKADATATPDPKYKELGKGEEKIKDWDTTWLEFEYDGAKSKVWSSKKFGAGLMVKMENKQGTMELVEFTEGK